MVTSNLILIEQVCLNCKVEDSFLQSLNDCGLVEIIDFENNKYISNDQLKVIEQAIHFHYELNINIEGIDAIHHLLNQIKDLQEELRITRNKLDLFDFE